MLDEGDQRLDAGAGDAGVAQHDGHLGLEVDRRPYLLGFVAVRPVELVDGDDESDAAPLEEVDGGEAVVEAAGVGEHDRAERAPDSSSHMNQKRSWPGVPKR